MRSAFVLIWSDNSQDYNFAFHLFPTFLIKCKCGELHLFRALLPSDQWPWQHGSLKLHSDRMILSIEWGLACNVTIWTSSRHKLSGTSPFSSLQSKTFTFLQPSNKRILVSFVSSFQPNHSTKMLLTSLHFYNIIKKGKLYWKQLNWSNLPSITKTLWKDFSKLIGMQSAEITCNRQQDHI